VAISLTLIDGLFQGTVINLIVGILGGGLGRPILGILCVPNMPEWQVIPMGMDIGALLGSGPRWRWLVCIIGDCRLCKLKNGINQPKRR
jgi:hypothetical protein